MRSTPPAACRRHQCTFRLIPTASTKPFGVTIATAAEFPAEPKRDNKRRSVELRPHCWTPIELAAGIHLCGSFPNEDSGRHGRHSSTTVAVQPEETPLGDIERFPPFRGEPMSPVPRSSWAASESLGGLGSSNRDHECPRALMMVAEDEAALVIKGEGCSKPLGGGSSSGPGAATA